MEETVIMRKTKHREVATVAKEEYPPQFAFEAIDPLAGNHRIEREVQRELLSEPRLKFSSLVIRRMNNNGVCLQGVLEADDESPDVCSLAQRVSGVEQVLNHLVVTPRK